MCVSVESVHSDLVNQVVPGRMYLVLVWSGWEANWFGQSYWFSLSDIVKQVGLVRL